MQTTTNFQQNIPFRKVMEQLNRQNTKTDDIWTDEEILLIKSESDAKAIALFLECLGYEVVTGYYDPQEDSRDQCEDKYTGYHYIDIA